MRRYYLLALLAASALARAEPPQDQWFTVLLDGRKIGSFESTRTLRDDRVVTTQSLDIALERAGSMVALSSEESNTETRDGMPLAFASVSRLSGAATRIEGQVHGGVIDVATSGAGGTAAHRQVAWPKGAVMAESSRIAGERAGITPGTTYTVSVFQPSSLDAARVSNVVSTPEDIDLPSGKKRLIPVKQTIRLGGTDIANRIWIDDEQTIYKLTMPALGVDLTLLECDRACATAPNQSSDVFERTLVKSPRALTPQERGGTLRFTLTATDGKTRLALPETDEQQVRYAGDTTIVTISRDARHGTEAAPRKDDRTSNDWLQSSAPEVTALAHKAIGDAHDPHARMQHIENFVRRFISDKSLNVGYASALEVVRKPEGDCTEHAVLVAALGRSVGIATRVVDGLVYTGAFAGRQRVFVPHAWAQAWVDGRWQSFDAALDGFDTGHIALSIGDGDPWRFYSGLDLLGRIDLRTVASVR